jgi:hypothetical protein
VTLAPRGLLIEEQRTNSIRNNTMVGAVAGTPGTLPTNWGFVSAQSNGLTVTQVGTGVESGINYIDYRFFGTTVNTNAIAFGVDGGAAATGQSWTGSVFWRLVGGTATGISSWNIGLIENTSGGSFVAGAFYPVTAPTSAALSAQRYSATRTLSGGGTVGLCQLVLNLSPLNATAIDFTIRIGMPQLEQGAFATSVIPTTTAAATRAADVATMIGANFSNWYNQTEGTLFGEASSFGGAVAGMYEVSASGAAAQSVSVRIGQQFSFAQGLNRASFTYTTGNSIRHAFGYKANNYGAASNATLLTIVNGNPSDVPANANQMTLGCLGTGTFHLNGHIRRIGYYPRRLANTELQTITS